MTILSSRSRRRLRSRSGGAHVGGLRRRPRLAHVEPVHGLGAGQRRQAEGGRDALLGLQADQAALPVPDAGSGEDRRVRASAEGHPGRPALPASTRITATSSSRSGRTRPDSAPGRSPRGRPTAPCADSGWPTSASSATLTRRRPGARRGLGNRPALAAVAHVPEHPLVACGRGEVAGCAEPVGGAELGPEPIG
jgi:hypothetical protein